jgi:hypothetical protein
VLFDFEPGVIDAARASPLRELFRPVDLVNQNAGSGNNWAKAHYTKDGQVSRLIPLRYSGLCSKLKAPHQGTSPRFLSVWGLGILAVLMVLFASGRVSGGPRRGFVQQAQAAYLRFKHASAVARPSAKRLELAEGTSPRRIMLPRCASAELLFSCFGSVAALPALENCNGHVPKTNISRPHPPTPSALCTAPTAREAGVVKPLHSPV